MRRDRRFVHRVARHTALGLRWRERRLRRSAGGRSGTATRSTVVVLSVIAVAAGCGTEQGALAGSPDAVRDLVAEIEAAPVPLSYRYIYEPISAMFLSCTSGVEEIDVIVDTEQRAVRLTPRHRRGAVYSLDGVALIDSALLEGSPVDAPFGSLALGADPSDQLLARLDTALGTALANQLAGGSWPNHPSDVVAELVSVATSITRPEPEARVLRFVLDPERYAREVGTAAEVPPIIDVEVNTDGTVGRIIVRAADPADIARPAPESDGYALTFDYSSATGLQVPDDADIAPLDPNRLPRQPTAVPCVVEP